MATTLTRSYSDLTGAEARAYVRSYKDLAQVWQKMNQRKSEGSLNASDRYWMRRMGDEFSITAFGEAHRGEDAALFHGLLTKGGIVKEARQGEPSAEYLRYFAGGQMRDPIGPQGLQADPESIEPVSLIEQGFDIEIPSEDAGPVDVDAPTNTADEVAAQVKTATSQLNQQLTELQTQLTVAQQASERAALGIPADAPANIKTYEQYRAYLAQQSAESGFQSTITTSMSGVEDITEGVRKTILTALSKMRTPSY